MLVKFTVLGKTKKTNYRKPSGVMIRVVAEYVNWLDRKICIVVSLDNLVDIKCLS
jgi:histidinol phosphatase-like enzyme